MGETPVENRGKYSIRIRDFISSNSDRISKIISDCTGKTRIEALSTEVLPAAMAEKLPKKSITFCIATPEKQIIAMPK